VAERLSSFDDGLTLLGVPPKRLTVTRKHVAYLASVDGYKRQSVNAKPIPGPKMKPAPKHFGLETGFAVEGDDVSRKVPAAPSLFNDSDLGVANESGPDQELENERNCDEQDDNYDADVYCPRGHFFLLERLSGNKENSMKFEAPLPSATTS